MTKHEAFMARAVAAARAAPHRTSPNPTVGCVIVRGGQIIATGVTQPAGEAHAEIMALRAAGEAARGADLYVSLEPCSHVGRTPPCTEAIIRAGVGRVFVGSTDPNPIVNGRGVERLRGAGVHTVEQVLSAECARLVAPFRRFICDHRPWVLLKAAVSLDGRIAVASGDSKWITGPAARAEGHRLRAWADAVLVGAGTARADDPRLTVRDAPGEDPLRVVLSRGASVAPHARVAGPGALIMHGPEVPAARLTELHRAGTQTLEVPLGAGGLDLSAALRALAVRGAVRVLVEGGGRLHGSLLAARLADEACFFVAPRILGEGRPAVAVPSPPTVAAAWSLSEVEHSSLGPDVRIRGLIRYPSGALDAEG